MQSKKVQFTSEHGCQLSGRLEFPVDSKIHAYAVFAHVFTGNKNLTATRYISRCLTQNGIAVLRFDFTGLGDSEGDFADTNFTSNVEDILAAAEFLTENYEAPKLLVGHSLGGAAVIFAASQLPYIQAIATVGTPSEPEHVTHLIQDSIETIEATGKAKVNIGGRVFTIKKQFLDDLNNKNMHGVLRELRKPLLVMHSPQDTIVAVENAAEIYRAARHPKSFVSLNGADHMLTNKTDAHYVGNLVGAWLSRYIDIPKPDALKTDKQVVARLDNTGYTTEIKAGRHALLADEPEDVGGNDFGPSPYELLSASLASCKAMTMHMYARRKKWDLQEAQVHISHSRRYAEDCTDCENADKRIEHFDCTIELEGNLTEEQRQRILEISKRCPVHKTLQSTVKIESKLT